MTLARWSILAVFVLTIMTVAGCDSASAQEQGQMVRLSKLVIDATALVPEMKINDCRAHGTSEVAAS